MTSSLSGGRRTTAFSGERGGGHGRRRLAGRCGGVGRGHYGHIRQGTSINKGHPMASVCRSLGRFQSMKCLKFFENMIELPASSRAGACSLIRAGKSFATQGIPTRRSVLQKNTQTENTEHGLANHSHSLWGSSVHGTNPSHTHSLTHALHTPM